MPEFLSLLDVGFFAAIIRIATPLLLATLGELYCERSGVLNLGIEGIMLLGAMVGFTVTYFTGELWLGVAAALATGALCGLMMALLDERGVTREEADRIRDMIEKARRTKPKPRS